MKNNNIVLPTPNNIEVEKYLKKWDSLKNYVYQESSLKKLFTETYKYNTDINDILIKASTLNDFYSTNIFSVFSVAEHILELNIDSRIQSGDEMLVNDISKVNIKGKEKCFYSFASKYCSHHNPLSFPIYDSYVEKVLKYFRNRDHFSEFSNQDLKDYSKFKQILIEFKKHYNIDSYNLKELDKYLWQLGKDYFKNNGKGGA